MSVQLNYDQILPKALVHKWSIDQVLLTDVAQVSATQMLLGGQVPRSHGLYCEHHLAGNRNPDIAALVEMCRQGCFVVAHRGFDVPLVGNRFQFLFQELDAELSLPPARASGQAEVLRPVNLRLACDIERQWRRGTELSGLAWVFRLHTEDGSRDVGRVRIRQMWIDREQWRQMRAMMRRDRGLPEEARIAVPPPSEMDPATVGKVNPSNVLLARAWPTREGFEAVARVDIHHPVFFDHSIDHIYAMVQTEAARQLALHAVASKQGLPALQLEVCGCVARYESVGEFDVETRLVAQLDTGNDAATSRVSIALMQDQRRISTFTIDVRRAMAG